MYLFRSENEDEDEDAMIDSLLDNEFSLLRFTPPESMEDIPIISPVNDIWMFGCFLIELLSLNKVWEGYSESELIKALKTNQLPKIPKDFPQMAWGVLYECLNPYYKARTDIKDIFTRFYRLMGKMSHSDLQCRIGSKIF
jgi:serine/threonine protein kinase